MYDAKLLENNDKQAEKDLIRCNCICDIGYFNNHRNIKLVSATSYHVPTEGILNLK
ncbi:hypothetical protein [Clostridium felsineum]|uniref:Uncharacterized protein n=1 Tax=Clostridium felsineum TaxID=36839 RepID=A0A1S8L4V1_9CLOT|nr:hypothetical protein [Clostridium felsineum]MCR3761267.1 hypothetical protein [Clostridium felsineum]URZ00676.1 hypothetical protein CLAUR_006640 [Clostridium felsineum]URZ06684.1 hypothetical protein CLROS_020170 [Clostridium felsineum]URZ11717.1 hypothetical protein CROST_024340 [Clostridium felsineum]URZ16277.1 hypothetical protein CLFE_023240 [Clostridium felsineum DSM 794]